VTKNKCRDVCQVIAEARLEQIYYTMFLLYCLTNRKLEKAVNEKGVGY